MQKQIPYALKSSIVEFSRDRKKPRSHTALSTKELKSKGQQSISQIVDRLDRQERPKTRMVQQLKQQTLSGHDLYLYKRAKQDLRRYQELRHTQDPLAPPILRREPHYHRYLPFEFREYLQLHPYSKKVYVTLWRDHILVFFNHQGLKVVNYVLPPGFDGNEDQALLLLRHGPPLDFHVVPLW